MKTTTRCKKAILRSFRKIDGVALLAIMAIGMPAFAADLTLVGDSAACWNSNSTIWTNATAGGALVKFSDGDNILVSSDCFTGRSLQMDGRFNPGNAVFDISGTLLFGWGNNNKYGLGPDTGLFTKRGIGTLILTDYLSGSHKTQSGDTGRGNGMTNGVEIVEGEIACLDPNNHNFLGPRTVPYWVYVRNGASLTFLERNQTGTYGYEECGIKIQLDEGAVLNICTNYAEAMPPTPIPLCVNTLKLNGGTVNVGAQWHPYSNKPNKWTYDLGGDDGSGISPSMYVFNTIHFSGDEKQSLGCGNDFTTNKNHLISLRVWDPVEIRVDDIVDGTDAEMCMKGFVWGTNSVGVYRCDLVKTGSGTLLISDNNYTKVNNNDTRWRFRGDLFISEGSVRFSSETGGQNFFQAGAEDPLQTITVSTNGTMIIDKRNITKPAGENTPNIKIVVDHGKLVYDTSEADAGALTAKDWVFDDAELEIHNKGFNKFIGVLVFRNSVTFRGSKPLVMWPDENLNTDWQAVNVYNGYRTMNYGTENGPVTTFDVADMTGDGRTDVVMGYHIWNGVTNSNQNSVFTDSGFIKKGLGTFSVASMANKVSGVVAVSNGTLRVDGRLVTPSKVDVAAGAFIGGTGTVARVEMEAGSGFDAPAGQDTPLTVEGDLVLPATGTVNISNLDGLAANNLPASKLVTVTGTLSGAANLANWTVTIDGVPASSYEVAISGNIVRVSKKCGLTITFW